MKFGFDWPSGFRGEDLNYIKYNIGIKSLLNLELLLSSFFSQVGIMAYTCLIVLDPEIPFTLPEMKGISGPDGANYKVIKYLTPPVLLRSLCKFCYSYLVINYLLIIDISI